MSMPERLWVETGTILEAIGLSISGTRLKDEPFPDSVEYARADALPTRAQIDRLVEALPDWPGTAFRGCVLLHETADAVGREDIRAALYRAAGIEGDG